MKFNWGHGILVFFTLFLSLAFYFIFFSFQHKNDLVTKDYYEKGANYSMQMQIDKRSVLFADSIVLKQEAELLLFDCHQYIPQNTDTIQLHFFRPSDKQLDYHANISLDSDGFVIDKKVLAKGRYELKIYWQMNGAAYYLKKDLQIK